MPLFLFGILFFVLHHYHGKYCERKDFKTFSDYALGIFLYTVFSLIFSLIFMMYVFLPWWIPTYQGGPLLP